MLQETATADPSRSLLSAGEFWTVPATWRTIAGDMFEWINLQRKPR
jgi:hypothetical protein